LISVSGVAVKRVAFGRVGNWENLVQETIDHSAYTAVCVDFGEFDLALFDYAVPLTLQDAVTLRSRYGQRNAKYMLPGIKATALCADKKIFNEKILKSVYGWIIPPMFQTAARVYPYVLKKRVQLSGLDTFVIRSAADEASHAGRLGSHEYFCQSYVPGKLEYATHMLLVDGRVAYHSTNAYEMAGDFAIKGNEMKPVREVIGIDAHPDLIDGFGNLLRMIGFNGICCIDYKIFDGRVRLLEVNPRVGFSLFRDINRFLDAYRNALLDRFANVRTEVA
jgi:hypothetical protein